MPQGQRIRFALHKRAVNAIKAATANAKKEFTDHQACSMERRQENQVRLETAGESSNAAEVQKPLAVSRYR